MKPWNPAWLLCVAACVLAFGPGGGTAAEEGTIEGVIKVVAGNDEIVYGEWIRVLLVNDAVKIPQIDIDPNQGESTRIDSIINAHLTFYKHVMEKAQETSYIISSTLTQPDGAFKFSGIAAGRYYIVVTFPSIIQGRKVAWQVPVVAVAAKTVRVELTEANFILPTYCRE